MEDLNGSKPLFKKIDRSVFEHIDKFKTTPNYVVISDFYNGLEEEQQKAFKAFITAVLFILPIILITFLWWQNGRLKDDLAIRTATMEKAQEILGQKESLQQVEPQILSPNPIDSDSMMTSRLSGILSSSGIDTSRVRVSNFTSDAISTTVYRSEADIAFTNFSTDEMVNVFTAMITREKFRIENVQITRSPDTNLLNGQFHAVHLSGTTPVEEE
jgi:hypothetical protein